MDPVLKEAASVSGARYFSSVRKITMRLLAPGLIAIYQAITALGMFEIPGVLGMPGNIHVFATKIYSIHQADFVMAVYGRATALAMLYLLIGVVAAFLYWHLIKGSEKFTVVIGKGYRSRLMALGRWNGLAFGGVILFLALTVILPFLVLLYSSLVPYLQPPSWEAFSSMTLRHYRELWEFQRLGMTVWNTIFMVAVTATATTLISFLISFVIVRSKFWGRRAFDQLTYLPHAIPGIVAGGAFFWVFIKIDQILDITFFFGDILGICIAFTVIFIPYGTRSMNAAILQIHKDL